MSTLPGAMALWLLAADGGGAEPEPAAPVDEAVRELEGVSDELVREAIALAEEQRHDEAAAKMRQAYLALPPRDAAGEYGRTLLRDALDLHRKAYEDTRDMQFLADVHELLEGHFDLLERDDRLGDIAPRALVDLRDGLEEVREARIEYAQRLLESGRYEQAGAVAEECYRATRASQRAQDRVEWVLLVASRAHREAWAETDRVAYLQRAKALLESHVLLGGTAGSRRVRNELRLVDATLKAAAMVPGDPDAEPLGPRPRTPRDRQVVLGAGLALASGGLWSTGGAVLAGTSVTLDDFVDGQPLTKDEDWLHLGLAIPMVLGGTTSAVLATRMLVHDGRLSGKNRKILGLTATPLGAICVAVGTGVLVSGIARWRSRGGVGVDMQTEIQQAEAAVARQRVGLGLAFGGVLPLGVGITALVARPR